MVGAWLASKYHIPPLVPVHNSCGRWLPPPFCARSSEINLNPARLETVTVEACISTQFCGKINVESSPVIDTIRFQMGALSLTPEQSKPNHSGEIPVRVRLPANEITPCPNAMLVKIRVGLARI